MDNDNKLKKAIVEIYRKSKLKLDYLSMNLASEEDGNALIASAIRENKPFAVGRFGAVEMRLVTRFSAMRGGVFCNRKRKCNVCGRYISE